MTGAVGLAGLHAGFAGQVLTEGTPDYDEARVMFNAMVDKRPAVFAQCDNAADVAAAIRYARSHGLEIAVRGGGHGVAGTGITEGGLVIDLRRMSTVTVDVAARTARVAGGATMSHLDRACQPHGLATTGGRVSTTGVGGFTLGGGTGWLDRKFGLACDNLLAVELVTASGDLVVADEDRHPDLFWALHGGGGNFGVATSLTFRLHELAAVTAAVLLWEAPAGIEVLKAYRDLIESAPDDVGGAAIFLTGPEEEFVPQHLVGELALMVLVTYTGPAAEVPDVIAPLVALQPASQMTMELPYAELQCMLDDPPGLRNYWSAEHLASFPDQAVEAFTGAADQMIVPSASQHVLFPAGGAAGRSTADYPIPWRTAPWVAHPFAMWTDPADDDRAKGWTRAVRSAVRPWSTGAVYLNFIGDEGADRVRAGFGVANWERLVSVKRAYDPDNAFRLNHNIDPT